MKKIYTTLVLLCAVAFANGQVVNIPDVNFKAYLIAADSNTLSVGFGWDDVNYLPTSYGVVDANNDGEIQVSEAIAVTHIYIHNTNLISLNDLNIFTNLKSIKIQNNNQITSVDLFGLFELQILNCNYNTMSFS